MVDASSALVVSGYPRSGTTWLAEIIASVPHYGIIFEPLSIERVRIARRAGLNWHNFHLPDEEWHAGEHLLKEILEGRVLTPWTTSLMSCRQACNVRRWVVKMVRANQMLGWLVARFNIAPPILLIRHPCAVLVSREARGWPTPRRPTVNESFLNTYPHLRPIVENLSYPEEHFAARWCMNYFAPFALSPPHPFRVVAYERLVREPMEEVHRIFSGWGINMPRNIEERINRPSGKASAALVVRSGMDIGAWRTRLDETRMRRMLEVLRSFGLDFYTDSPEPDFERLLSGQPLHLERS